MNKQFAKWLDITMENREISGNELASLLNVNISQVSRWRNGHILPSLDTIDKIANVFDVDPARLAVLAGRLPLDMTQVDPLPIPEPKIRTQRITELLSGIRGVTPAQRDAMIRAYRKTVKEGK
jgi:transcriptional regulator with XRE-family HTH domain